MVVICFAAIEVTPPEERGERSDVNASFTGVVMLSARSVSGMFKYQLVIRWKHPTIATTRYSVQL